MPGWGPVSARVGNACIETLGAMPGAESAAELGRLQVKVKYSEAQRLIEQALEASAERAGLPRDDLEELAVPDNGLDASGVRVERVGTFRAEIRIAGAAQVELLWHDDRGKSQKSIPAEVRRGHPDELKRIQRAVRDIARILPVQRARIERLLLTERSWPLKEWRKRYFDHPLLQNISRRLIWRVRVGERTALCIWENARLVDAASRPIDSLGDDAVVSLWHPLGTDVETVRCWRSYLQRMQVQQPFKQAHREIYLVTDAELRTETYSNRFAAHVLRQQQFAALCRERGWTYRLQGHFFEGSNTPTLLLPRWKMRAEFWVEGMREDDAAVIYSHIATDQVRFYRAEEDEPCELTRVDPLVFSEVMRDVDLFVGVCSVGTDPTWRDRGDAPDREYWDRFAFGELSGSAQMRRAVLEEFLPRLRIADRCKLDGKFLVVRGDLCSYKIHLGSANILMEPNDQYLCIVPGRSAVEPRKGRIHLPFEGDETLSVILSKAFLLADDARIQDPAILKQIQQR
jgi:hypothetical protein